MAISPDIDDRSLVKLYCEAVDKLVNAPSGKAVLELCEAERLIVARFDPIARKYAYRRTDGKIPVDDVVQGFWDKVLTDNILASYEGRGNAAPRTFLLGVLYHHIQDEFRALGRRKMPAESSLDQSKHAPEADRTPGVAESDSLGWIERREPTEPSSKDLEDLPDLDRPPDELAKAQLEHLASCLVAKAIDVLSVCFPKDALLIRLQMDGIANARIIGENLLEEPDLNTDALKQRSSRARQRFRNILTRLCLDEDLSIQDLIEHFRGLNTSD